jgi:3-oxoacyl-[acyl-carrier-protein] synthase-3
MQRSRILGTGHYVPEQVVKNAALSARMTTSDAWIQQRTGIVERRHVDFTTQPMGASDLACRAAQRALEAAELEPEDIDLIVYATLSPDRQFPGDGVLVQAKLGIPAGVPALDVRNQCSGFLYALATADAFVRVGTYRRVLVIGSELQSSGLDFTDRGRDVAVLFGDGAGAVVLGRADDVEGAENEHGAPCGILGVQLHADGRYAHCLRLDFPSSAQARRVDVSTLEDGQQYPAMDGKTVFKHAVTRMPEVVEALLRTHHLRPSDIDLFIPHQANLRISEMVQARLGLQPQQVFNNIMAYGNTTAASIPLAIDEAVSQGRIKRGQLLCCAAFGAGFTWGAVLVRW